MHSLQEPLVLLKREVKSHFLSSATWLQAQRLRQNRHNLQRKKPAVLLGDSRARSWPAPKLAGLHFFNRGIGYDTSVNLLKRIDRHVIPLNPKLIILQIGVNDFQPLVLASAKEKTIVDKCQKTIQQIVARLGKEGCRVLLTTIFPIGDETSLRKNAQKSFGFWGIPQNQRARDAQTIIASAVASTNAFIATLASDNVQIFDTHQILRGEDDFTHPAYALDALHINQAGYRALNAAVERVGKTGLWMR